MPGIRIAVLVSGGGTNLQAIIDQIEQEKLPGQIEIVISSKEDAFALERAKAHGIEGICIGKKNFPSLKERENKIVAILEEKRIELVVLAGYLSILGENMVRKYKNKIINVHPSLIPSFCGKGFYGERVHRGVLDYGVKITGATVHFVDEGTDTGPIILQKSVEVLDGDTIETLASRVLKVEHELLPKAIQLLAEGKLEVVGRRVKING